MAEKPQKTCFVTIGATAAFDALIRAVLSPKFCNALQSHSYTHLLVQYGRDGKPLFDSCMQSLLTPNQSEDVKISGFDLDRAGLGPYMSQAKGNQSNKKNTATEGVVISHAGILSKPPTFNSHKHLLRKFFVTIKAPAQYSMPFEFQCHSL